jgi:hypothetical protein
MPLPVKTNTTCDIYRVGRLPPLAPDVTGVACYLSASYYKGLEHGEKDSAQFKYDHVMLVDLTVDIRDSYNTGSVGNPDQVFIPNHNGVIYAVVFVERRGWGTPFDHKRVYLSRTRPSTNALWQQQTAQATAGI